MGLYRLNCDVVRDVVGGRRRLQRRMKRRMKRRVRQDWNRGHRWMDAGDERLLDLEVADRFVRVAMG